jgi:membrane protease YdiL (CAAX protease family)
VVRLGQIENSALPWYQRAPEHWVYPVQCVIVGAMLLFFRKHYTLAPWRGLPLAGALAAVGIAAWVLPAMLYREGLPTWCEWLGMVTRKEGFDPSIFQSPHPSEPWREALYRSEIGDGLYEFSHHPFAWWATVLARFFRMVVIVPFVEELFWRGFLMRYVQAGDRDFRTVPFGQHTWKAFGIVTVAVTLIHNPSDYLGALVWGSLVYFVAVRTKSLGACVFMHAVGNLLLGLYVMQTKQWGFW